MTFAAVRGLAVTLMTYRRGGASRLVPPQQHDNENFRLRQKPIQ